MLIINPIHPTEHLSHKTQLEAKKNPQTHTGAHNLLYRNMWGDLMFIQSCPHFFLKLHLNEMECGSFNCSINL